MTHTALDPAPPRYILSLEADLQSSIAKRQREAAGIVNLIATSPSIVAVHLPARGPASDTILLAAFLAARLKNTGLFVEVDITRKHPVNVARSLVSLSHLTGHRIGWGLSPILEADAARNNPWLASPRPSGEGLSVRQEFAEAVTELSRTWPLEGLIGDRDRGWYNVAGSIRPVDRAGGHFAISGTLNIPGAPYGAIPFLSFGGDHEFHGHLQVAQETANAGAVDDAGLAFHPVAAPSSITIGRSVERGPLLYAEGLRDTDQLVRLKRATDLALPEGNAKAGTIWHLLGVRPSVEPVADASLSGGR